VATQAYSRWQILVYTLLVVIASLLLYLVHAMGPIYLTAAIVLGGVFVARAVLLYRSGTARRARQMFVYSNCYLAALFAAMIVDRLA
jgi:heme o synthase